MNQLLTDVDCMSTLLSNFTLEDARYFLRPVCRAFNEATRRPDVNWMKYASLAAALERLRRRYALGPTMRYYDG
jgi:hypothetical protein